MFENNIYELAGLKCSYDKNAGGNGIVLYIEHLSIPKGKIVFFVGRSGIGKSTILETLGFMNNTIYDVIKFEYKGYDVSGAWSWNDKIMSSFRNSEFSFFFQQNNLMPNFSAYENVMITAMLQGMSREEARDKAERLFAMMDLHVDDRPISEYSGGQRQRMAFARAIIPNFTILFGDEPTGNLDAKSAEDLMSMLSNIVKERQSTAIIVSHDMKLAIDYSDMIVMIQAVDKGNGNEFYGLINDRSIYTKLGNEWHFQNEKISGEYLYHNLKLEL